MSYFLKNIFFKLMTDVLHHLLKFEFETKLKLRETKS